MYKILLDDRFYQNTSQQNEYLERLLDSIKKYFDAKVIFFEPFYQSKKSYTLDYMSQMINKKIHNTHKCQKYNLSNVNISSDSTLAGIRFSPVFIGKIKYIIDNNPNDIIIIPLIYSYQNRNLKIKSECSTLFFIGNYDEEVESNICNWINNNQLIHILEPTISNKFPAKDLCEGYNNWRSEILKPLYKGDKISDFTKIGMEVALRNRYIYDSKLSALNKAKAKKDKNGNKPKRQVFKSSEKDVYLSTDFENGGFEVYDKNAHHQGQFKFNGDFEKSPDEDSHPLYLK